MGTHLRVLRESFPVNTKVAAFRCFSKFFPSLCLDESSRSIERVNYSSRKKSNYHLHRVSLKTALVPNLKAYLVSSQKGLRKSYKSTLRWWTKWKIIAKLQTMVNTVQLLKSCNRVVYRFVKKRSGLVFPQQNSFQCYLVLLLVLYIMSC